MSLASKTSTTKSSEELARNSDSCELVIMDRADSAEDVAPTTRPRRRTFTQKERAVLEEVFAKNMYPSAEVRNDLARQLQMTNVTIRQWFQNKRNNPKAVEMRENSMPTLGFGPDVPKEVAYKHAVKQPRVFHPRVCFSQDQLKVLVKEFEKWNSPNISERRDIAEQLGVSELSVKHWFQNTRHAMKSKKANLNDLMEKKARNGRKTSAQVVEQYVPERPQQMHYPSPPAAAPNSCHSRNGCKAPCNNSAQYRCGHPCTFEERATAQRNVPCNPPTQCGRNGRPNMHEERVKRSTTQRYALHDAERDIGATRSTTQRFAPHDVARDVGHRQAQFQSVPEAGSIQEAPRDVDRNVGATRSNTHRYAPCAVAKDVGATRNTTQRYTPYDVERNVGTTRSTTQRYAPYSVAKDVGVTRSTTQRYTPYDVSREVRATRIATQKCAARDVGPRPTQLQSVPEARSIQEALPQPALNGHRYMYVAGAGRTSQRTAVCSAPTSAATNQVQVSTAPEAEPQRTLNGYPQMHQERPATNITTASKDAPENAGTVQVPVPSAPDAGTAPEATTIPDAEPLPPAIHFDLLTSEDLDKILGEITSEEMGRLMNLLNELGVYL